jgi:hypothetical protein
MLNVIHLKVKRAVLAVFILVLAVSFLEARTNRPRSRKMEKYVRIDMACPATSEGISAAFPLVEMPLNILNEERLNWYRDNVLSDDFNNAYEFRSQSGRWVCYPNGGFDPVRLRETIFPPALSSFYKSIIQQSNTGVYSDLGLKESLDCLGISGKGLSGTDLTKMLNIPFRTSKNATLKKDYEDIEGMTFDVKDKAKFDVMFSNPDDDMNDNLVADHFTAFSAPANKTFTADFIFGGNIDSSAASTPTSLVANALNIIKRSVDMKLYATGPVGLSYATKKTTSVETVLFTTSTTVSNKRTSRTSGAQGFVTSTSHQIQLQGWPYSGSRGWCDLSSFSEIGDLTSGENGSVTSAPVGAKPATMIFLTPLSALDEGLASLAIRKELIRALRTRWIFTEKPASTFVDPIHHPNLMSGLLRTTPALWDYLAQNNAMEALKGVNAYQSVGPIPRARLTRDYGTIIGHLMRPSSLSPSMVKLPDFNRGSYFFPFDRKADNYYATAVFTAWKELWDTKVLGKLLGTLDRVLKTSILGKVEKSKAKIVSKAIASAIFAGYNEDTKFKTGAPSPLFERHKASLLDLYKPDTAQAVQSKYGINFESIKSPFTDLEWIANCIEPAPSSTGGGVPSTVVTGALTLLPSADLDKCGLSPLIYPFSPLRNSEEGKRILTFVRGLPAQGMNGATEGITSMEGLPFTSAPSNTFVLDVDPEAAKKLEAFCSAFFSNNYTSLPKGVSSTSVTTWTVAEATKATSSTTDAVKRQGYFRLQQEYEKAATGIIGRIKLHNWTGTPETALLVQKNMGTAIKPLYVFEQAPLANGGIPAGDSPASLFCSLFTPVNKFIDFRYSGTGGKFLDLLKNSKKKFFTTLKKDLTHEPMGCPEYFFNKYLAGDLIKDDGANSVRWDVDTFVRRTKELATSLGRTVSFKKSNGTEFVASGRKDY